MRGILDYECKVSIHIEEDVNEITMSDIEVIARLKKELESSIKDKFFSEAQNKVDVETIDCKILYRD